MGKRHDRPSPYRSNADRARCEDTGKVCLTNAEAHKAARMLNDKQRADGHPVGAFACHQCGTWHTGHVPKDRRTGKRRR